MKPAALLATSLLGIIALAHLVRLVLRIEITAAGNVIPVWVSLPACLVCGAIAVGLWRERRAP